MDLIERDHVLADLLPVVDAAMAGAGRVGIVRAPAGGGKTAVLGAVQRLAADRGVAVLAAAGVEQEMVVPYGIVHQLLDPLVRREPDLVSDGPAARAWEQLGSGAAADHTVPRGLHWLLTDAADHRPMVLLVDDHQWADRPSVAFIDYLAHRIAPSPISVIVATRDAASALDLSAMSAVWIELEPLTAAGVRALARGRLGVVDEETVAALHGATGGSPFLVQEALTILREHPDLPPDRAVTADLVASVRRRMRALDVDARRVTEALAVLGPSPSTDLVAEMVGLDALTTSGCGDRLASVHLTTKDACFTLCHPLVRSAVLEAIPGGHRAALHRRAADALSRRHASVLDVGQHLLRTQPQGDPDVADGLVAAGRAALAHGDPDTARLMLERAVAEPAPAATRTEIGLLLGSARRRVGDERAVDEFRHALDLAEPTGQRVAAIRGLLGALLSFGRLDELDDTMANELEQLTGDDPDTAIIVEAELLSAARHATHATLWNADRLRRWMGRITGRSPAERVLLANLATQASLDGHTAEQTAELARAALGGLRLVAEQTADSLTVYQPIWQLTAADLLDEARVALDSALTDARERGSIIGFALASLFTSYVDLARGDLTAAAANANAAMVAAEQLPSPWMVRPAIVAGVIDVNLERGDLEPSWALLEEHRLLGPLPDSTPHRLLLYSRARLHDASGNTDEAVADADELIRRHEAANVLSAHLVPGHAIAALTHARRGEIALAQQRSEENLRLATAWGTPRIVARALVVHARLQPPERALEILDRAIEQLSRVPAPLDQAWAHHHRGLIHVRLGHRAEAVADLRRALDLASAAGATALERLSREGLVHLGLRPRRSAITGIDALTVSERQVADLAARGHPNRDIAAALFVTPRTVESHLTSAYRKLGIASRSQLSAALAASH